MAVVDVPGNDIVFQKIVTPHVAERSRSTRTREISGKHAVAVGAGGAAIVVALRAKPVNAVAGTERSLNVYLTQYAAADLGQAQRSGVIEAADG